MRSERHSCQWRLLSTRLEGFRQVLNWDLLTWWMHAAHSQNFLNSRHCDCNRANATAASSNKYATTSFCFLAELLLLLLCCCFKEPLLLCCCFIEPLLLCCCFTSASFACLPVCLLVHSPSSVYLHTQILVLIFQTCSHQQLTDKDAILKTISN